MAKVLIIEDSLFQRNRIKKILTAGGYDLVEAGNGKEGLDKIESEQPDGVLCDLLMPEVDGMALLETLKANGSSTPVIILTSDIQDSVKEKCLSLGAKAFLNKPPKEEDLLQALQQVVGGGK